MNPVRPANSRLEIRKGSDFNRTWLLKSHHDNTPIDLTGYTARFAVDRIDGSSVVELDTSSGITIDGESGSVAVFISGNPDQTINTWDLSFDRARYELKIYSPDGARQAIGYGDVTFVLGIVDEE